MALARFRYPRESLRIPLNTTTPHFPKQSGPARAGPQRLAPRERERGAMLKDNINVRLGEKRTRGGGQVQEQEQGSEEREFRRC